MPDLATPWTVACPALLSLGFSRQEYWSGFPFPSPGDLPDEGLNLGLLHGRQILYHLSHQGSSKESLNYFPPLTSLKLRLRPT